MNKILLLFISMVVLGCNRQSNVVDIDCCPHCIIYIQPYESFTKEEVNKIIPELKKQFDYWLYGDWTFKVNDPIKLPANSKLTNYSKYEGLKILDFQKDIIEKNEVIIGLTHEDICYDIHNVKHYGIIGLSYCPGNVCIVSDKRIKNKSQMWKPILHEFMHAYYGAKHCPNDDPKCFMKDAKGHANFGIQNKLCNICDKYR